MILIHAVLNQRLCFFFLSLSEFIKQRRTGLHEFIQKIVTHPQLSNQWVQQSVFFIQCFMTIFIHEQLCWQVHHTHANVCSFQRSECPGHANIYYFIHSISCSCMFLILFYFFTCYFYRQPWCSRLSPNGQNPKCLRCFRGWRWEGLLPTVLFIYVRLVHFWLEKL